MSDLKAYKRVRVVAIAAFVVVVLFIVLMWAVFAPAAVAVNLVGTAAMILPLAGLVWCAVQAHRGVKWEEACNDW